MLSKIEYWGYREIIESPKTRKLLESIDPNGISRLGAECAAYYARLTGELADVKDQILAEFIRLVKDEEEGGEGMSAARAEKEAEAKVNSEHEVTRRQIEYILDGLDKLSYACGARMKMFGREGSNY